MISIHKIIIISHSIELLRNFFETLLGENVIELKMVLLKKGRWSKTWNFGFNITHNPEIYSRKYVWWRRYFEKEISPYRKSILWLGDLL